jgi:hypothetical protein
VLRGGGGRRGETTEEVGSRGGGGAGFRWVAAVGGILGLCWMGWGWRQS